MIIIRSYGNVGSPSGGGGVINNYASLGAPQLFNPDATAVSNNTDDYVLSSNNYVGLVTLNGQVLDDSEYGLVGNVLTVTPDNGFNSTSDEVLVFQYFFSASGTGVTTNFVQKAVSYAISVEDHTIEVTAAGDTTQTLPSAVGIAGQEFVIKNTGSGEVTIEGNGAETIDGALNVKINAPSSLTVKSNGTNFIII